MKTPTRRLLTLVVSAALAAAVVAELPTPSAEAQEKPASDPQQAPPEPGPRPDRGPRAAGRRAATRDGRGRVRRRQRAEARSELGRALAITDEQRRVFLEKARAAEPLVAQWRKDLAKQRVERESAPATATATPEDRAARRTANRALREKLAADLAPLAKDVVATLTPEQRARIEGFAAARGRQVTPERLERRAARLLARPMTVPMLEARLERR